MKTSDLQPAIVKASKISSGTRMDRIFRSPIKTAVPFVMRKLRINRPVTLNTAWGGRFSGVLPEAVTSEIWRSGTFELPVSLSLLKCLKPGGVYVDVGSHFGYFSLLASKLVGPDGRVLAVEAMPSTYGHLVNNVNLNAPYPNITTFQGAAYSDHREIEFKDFGVVASSLNSAFHARDTSNIIQNAGETVIVKTHPVDAIVAQNGIERIDLIKIDAESSEQFVLQGMAAIFKNQRPFIVMEVGDVETGGTSVDMIFSQMAAVDYTAYRWDENQVLQKFERQSNLGYANLLFCPNEKDVNA
jgi:FkbM family methyltransferase